MTVGLRPCLDQPQPWAAQCQELRGQQSELRDGPHVPCTSVLHLPSTSALPIALAPGIWWLGGQHVQISCCSHTSEACIRRVSMEDVHRHVAAARGGWPCGHSLPLLLWGGPRFKMTLGPGSGGGSEGGFLWQLLITPKHQEPSR